MEQTTSELTPQELEYYKENNLPMKGLFLITWLALIAVLYDKCSHHAHAAGMQTEKREASSVRRYE